MKNFNIYIGLITSILFFSACNDEFLERKPLDQVGSELYFKKPNDLKAYVNQYYSNTFFPRYNNYGNDFDSDNEIQSTVDRRLEGSLTVATSGSIGFGNVRSLNYFFDNYKRVEESYELAAYQQYVGEAYFFKALAYFSLLQSYGDIQWLDTELGTSSSELYKPRDPRNYVVDRIISALDTAAMYLTAEKTNGAGRVNKWMALLIQSRVALYEGTWEKYHNGTPFGVSNPQSDKYLNKVVEATTKIMDSKLYDIYSTGDPANDYKSLFSLMDYTGNTEVMFWRKYNNDLSQGSSSFTNDRNFRMQTPAGKSMTKQMVDSYLCIDGKPIAGNSLFQGYSSLSEEVKNRDPRFKQTIATADQIWKIQSNGSTLNWDQVYGKLNSSTDYNSPAGYIIQKGYNPNVNFHVQQFEETPSILYRYAEVLLNYAEAKAELGTITQGDIDITIKKLRDRVNMPNLSLSNISADPNWNFPTLSPIINEVRRERRVELVAEGFRWDDIARWAAADELIVGKRPKGFLASQVSQNPFTVDQNGFLDPFQRALPNGYQFRLDRDYLSSIPESEIALNPENLTQNPGWK